MSALYTATKGWISPNNNAVVTASKGWLSYPVGVVVFVKREVLRLTSRIKKRLILDSKIWND